MKRTSNLTQKKNFLRWFLSKQQLKTPELSRLLHFIAESDDLLRKVRFVENIRYYSDAILVSAEDSNTIPYIMRIDNRYIFDVDEFIKALTSDPPSRLYIWLSFNRDYICSFCPNVIDRKGSRTLSKRQIRGLEREISEQVYLKELAKQKLMEQIDTALEKGCKEEFFRLTHQLKKISQ